MGRLKEEPTVIDAVKGILLDRQKLKGEAFVLDECNLKGRSVTDVQKEVAEGKHSEGFKQGAADALYQITSGEKK